MRKSFDDLTIADDFMLCKVMQDEAICKKFLEMVLAGKIGKITYLSSQNSIAAGSEAKSIRLDILVKDEAGKSYDIEMQVANEYNIPKRMRYYQAALDISFLDKGLHYKTLNDSYIIFVCLFDAIGKVKVEMPTTSVGIPFAYLHQPLVGPFKCKHKRNVYAFFMRLYEQKRQNPKSL